MLSQKTNTQANNCKSLNIHRKAKESSAELLDTYFFLSLKRNINLALLYVSHFLALDSLYCSGWCHVSEVVSAHTYSGQGWQQPGSWIVLPWMAVAVPSQTCQLGWHQCSDSWFGTRSGRQRRKCVLCVCFYVWCYLSWGRLVCRVGGMAVWVNRKLLDRQD